MQSVRLIKRKDVEEQEKERNLSEKEHAEETAAAKNPIEVVRGWVNERQASQKQKARQMFSSLFA
ncbi:MAG: hypothetical protein HY231_25840 [Acidobacteria bacterium]|nr:hypothetical protein [Acidobacteriota bacterium]